MLLEFLKSPAIIDPQLDYLLFLQNLRAFSSDFFDSFFLLITKFGEVSFPFCIMLFIYWCVDKKSGMFMLLTGSYCILFNIFIKLSACIYRPWILNPQIKPVKDAFLMAYGYSFPSGHTATATSVFGSLAYVYKKNKPLVIVSFLMIFLVMFSRNYLGVHTIQDVFVSFVLSVLIIFLTDFLLSWVEKGKNRDVILFVFSILLTFFIMTYIYFKNYPMDYLNGKLLVDGMSIKISSFSNFGFCSGIFTGWFLSRRYIDFEPSNGNIFEKILRLAFGVIILSFLLGHVKEIFIDFFNPILGRFLIFFLVALFMTVFYPFVFVKFKQFSSMFFKNFVALK